MFIVGRKNNPLFPKFDFNFASPKVSMNKTLKRVALFIADQRMRQGKYKPQTTNHKQNNKVVVVGKQRPVASN